MVKQPTKEEYEEMDRIRFPFMFNQAERLARGKKKVGRVSKLEIRLAAKELAKKGRRVA